MYFPKITRRFIGLVKLGHVMSNDNRKEVIALFEGKYVFYCD
jgi:hypothetical protein